MSITKSKQHKIFFEESDYKPLEICDGTNLSEVLNSLNSPVLFGCRTGLCGTCVVKVLPVGNEKMDPPTLDEQLILGTICPNEPNARLACQIRLNADITLKLIPQK